MVVPKLTSHSILYQRYTKGIQTVGAMKYGCPFLSISHKIGIFLAHIKKGRLRGYTTLTNYLKKCSLRQKKQVFLAHIHFFV